MIRARKIIVDTSVLISLAKIDRLEILARITDNLAIPEDVYEEAVVEGEKKDIPDATIIKMFIAGEIKFRDFEKSIRSLVLENRLGSAVAELYIMEGQEYVEL